MTDNTIGEAEAASGERLEEIAGMLQSSLIIPLENLEELLRKMWTQDEAAGVFLSHLDMHLDSLRAVKSVLQDMYDGSDPL